MRAWGREPLFVLFLGLVHRSIIKSAAVHHLALIIWGGIGGRLMRIFFDQPCVYKFCLSPCCLHFLYDSAVCHLISVLVTQTCSGIADGAPLSELSWPSSLAVVAVSFSGLFTFIFLMLACLCCKKGDIGFKVSSLLPPSGSDEKSKSPNGGNLNPFYFFFYQICRPCFAAQKFKFSSV